MKRDRAFKFILAVGMAVIILAICAITISSSTPSGEHVVVNRHDLKGIFPQHFVLDIETGEFIFWFENVHPNQMILKSIKITTPVDQTECMITTPLPIDIYPYPNDLVRINGTNCFLSEDEFDRKYASLNVEITYDIIPQKGEIYQENITERGSIRFVTTRIHEIQERENKYFGILVIISLLIILWSVSTIVANIGRSKKSLKKYSMIFTALMIIFWTIVLLISLDILSSLLSFEVTRIILSVLVITYTVSLVILLCSTPLVIKYYGGVKGLSLLIPLYFLLMLPLLYLWSGLHP